MFRIIDPSLTIGQHRPIQPEKVTKGKASKIAKETGFGIGSVFGGTKMLHSRPRLYKHLDTAIRRAIRQGTGDIMDDERNVVAVVSKGKLIGLAPGYTSIYKE